MGSETGGQDGDALSRQQTWTGGHGSVHPEWSHDTTMPQRIAVLEDQREKWFQEAHRMYREYCTLKAELAALRKADHDELTEAQMQLAALREAVDALREDGRSRGAPDILGDVRAQATLLDALYAAREGKGQTA